MTKSSDPDSRTNTSLGPAVARAIRPFDRALQSALLPGPPPPPSCRGRRRRKSAGGTDGADAISSERGRGPPCDVLRTCKYEGVYHVNGAVLCCLAEGKLLAISRGRRRRRRCGVPGLWRGRGARNVVRSGA